MSAAAQCGAAVPAGGAAADVGSEGRAGPNQVVVAAAPAAPRAGAGTVVLDTYSVWRMHYELKPPVLATGEKVSFKYRWLNYETAPPPGDWAETEFNDQSWHRGPVTLAIKSALLAGLACVGSSR